MTKRKRLAPEVRKEELLSHALRIAARVGYAHVTRPMIAEAAGVTPVLVSYHFGTMIAFRRTLMRAAVAQAAHNADARRVVLQGHMAKDKQAAKVSPEVFGIAMAEMGA
jgi:AcrR family transcriptional regulator